ncbi:TPA: transcriptional regulator [Listeria monocytogenes]|nr:Rgg/GadR/MutR family transcriptional regulator [Listeria monocytogenes]EAF4456062.1 Rgg/GadR/MutR family transcriptional regulator [Listeria monocytogenes serotype 4b]EHC6194466.1 transcriptional regulator [Listeria monocytogenes serotype 1/2a]EAC6780774.1 Rgg/GadR/MutR family transcriptional regulator [Listeria monocytogenes]EAD0722592.1 Rgg/GadR/MutR family transcriptional regulator [Listeria monocytogenes]
MINYGTLIRQIRKAKKISQKEVYTGIISKSYGIEFEKGEHAISSVLLEKIVTKLMMSMEEFIVMYHHVNEKEMEEFWEEYDCALNGKDATKWKKLYKKVSLEEGKVSQVKKAAILLEMNHVYPHESLDEEALNTIETYLSEALFWTLQDIYLLTRVLRYMPVKSRELFYCRIVKTIERYSYFEQGRRAFRNLLGYIMKDLVERNKLNYMELMIEGLEKISVGYEGIYFKILCMYYSGINQLGNGKKNEGNKNVRQAIYLLCALDYVDRAKLYETLYLQFVRNIGKQEWVI